MTKPEQCRAAEQRFLCCGWEQPATSVSGPSGPSSCNPGRSHHFGRSWVFPGRRQWEWLGPSNLSPPAHLAPSDQRTLCVNTDQCTVVELPRCWWQKPQTARSPAPSSIVAAQSDSRYNPSNRDWGADIHPQATEAQTSS
uniref:Uncharacterized protein n=1 Tax=Molossus molossus TaxID=27622 RepID=A0A7J8GQT3_MOLMO|nr:hypothetical protein HJG59_011332 [Molossus molossus]